MVTPVDIDTVRALREMRVGILVCLVLAAGCFIANLAEISIVGDIFIGGMVGYLLQRFISVTSKIRELELVDPD